MEEVLIKVINMGDPDDWDLYAQMAIHDWTLTEEYERIKAYGLVADSYKYHDQNSWGGDFNLSGCGVYCKSYDPESLMLARLAGIIPSGNTSKKITIK